MHGNGQGPIPRPDRAESQAEGLGARLAAWLDNPILVKHKRSRLRRGQFLPPAVIVIVLCMLIAFNGWANDTFPTGSVFGMVFGLQAILLLIAGSWQITAAVGGARESGILDFHRVSPLPPATVALGFFFGAPIREYALAACTLPLALYCLTYGSPTVATFLQLTIALILAAWVVHGATLYNALTARKPRAGAWLLLGFLIFGLMSFSGFATARGSGRAVGSLDEGAKLGFFGMDLPWLLVVTIHLAPALFFLLLASTRKMRSERAHPLAKPQALACLTTLAVLLLGSLWNAGAAGVTTLLVTYILVIAALFLTVAGTPTAGEYARGVRRATRLGRAHLGPWADLALNRVGLAALCGIVLIATTAAWKFIEEPAPDAFGFRVGLPVRPNYGLPIAIGVFVVAYFGLAYQYFVLAFPKRGTTYMGLFLFLAWIVPLISGLIAGGALGGGPTAAFIVCLSPILGIGMATGLQSDMGQAAQLGALLPAIFFAFLFNNLVTSARRRLDAEARATPEGKPIVAPEEELVVI